MTLDEFLDDYVPRVLKPMGGWAIDAEGAIRRGESCPVTAESGRAACFFPDEGRRLGLAFSVPGDIAIAADFRDIKKLHPVRARLLAGLGLQEG
jgi:hypothetical protein